MSGVVYLPPRRKRRLPSALGRLRSVLRRPPHTGTDAGTGAGTGGALRVGSRRAGGQHIIVVSGTLSAGTRPRLVAALEDVLEGDAERIVLDLGDLESIDHAGFDAVLTAHLRACDQLKVLVIVPGPEPVQRAFANARAPFLYATRHGARPVGRLRSRGGRTLLSGRPPRAGPRRRSARGSG